MPMKVIVCFDEVRVTVPCGDGDIPVSELIVKAVHRYKRATGKGSDIAVSVTSLKTISGGGILDPDDQLNDVVDDREQLIAEFDEPGRVRPPPHSHSQYSYHSHNGGDGGTASSCSTGAVSPDVFQSGDTVTTDSIITIPAFLPPPAARRRHHNSSSSASSSTNNTSAAANNTDVVVTPRDLTLGSNLRVRRGSDPGLNILDTLVKEASTIKPVVPLRPSITRRESVRESDDPKSESSEDEKRMKMAAYGSLDRKRFSHKFTRDVTRASLSNRPEMARWVEAQERRMDIATLKKIEPTKNIDTKDNSDSVQDESRILVTIQNDGGPLGIHAVPAYDDNLKSIGLLIQSVEPGRPVDRDGRIFPNDIVVEINGFDLYEVPFISAQDIFRSAMQSSDINLAVIKDRTPPTPTSPPPLDSASTLPKSNKSKQRQAPPPPVMPKPRNHIPNKPSPLTLPTQTIGSATDSSPPIDSNSTSSDLQHNRVNSGDYDDAVSLHLSRQQQQQQQDLSQSANSHLHPHNQPPHHHHHHSQNSSSSSCSSIPPSSSSSSKQPNGSMTSFSAGTNAVIKPGPPLRPPKKAPAPAIPTRNPKTSLTTPHTQESPININALTNTRRIGKRINIQLKKGLLGLGFSVTSRDNQTDGECPIYIRNILPKGAAIQDGNLRIGDRLLEVNGVEMTGKNQAEAVTLLRLLPEGSLVELVVSRQEEVDDRFKVPRPLPVTKGIGNDLDSPPGFTKEKITLRIPLNDTGSAGLGVSVKGKTQTKESGLVEDLGIFIKTVLQGGAASKDGRLQINDQLLEVNDFNLVGLTNNTAMEALRSAMLDDNQHGGHITLSVARYSGGAVSPSLFQYGDSPDHPHSNYPSNANGAIFHQRSSSSNDSSAYATPAFIDSGDMPSPIPPVRSKRVGQLRDKFNELSSTIRNESYTKATHDSLNDSSTFTNIMPPSPSKSSQPLKQKNSMSEQDDQDVYAVSSKMQRPHSTIGFLHGPKMSQSSYSDDEGFRRASTASSKDDSDLSPQGEPILPFAREGFGRQSMSEKRKGHIDPRSTEVYKQAKANKENKGGFLNRRVRSFHVTGTYHPPSQPVHSDAFNIMKKSSSVEDLTNAQQSVERPPPIPPHPNSTNVSSGGGSGSGGSSAHQQALEASPAWQTRFGRARACNDSFRAAVDRSYDIMDPNPMDTLEEESLENSAFNLDPSFSGRSSMSSEDTNSLKRQKGKDKDKDKKGGGGLLKGFLRFGKGRKSNEEALRRSRSEERSAHKNNNHQVPRRAEHSMDRNNASSRSNDSTEHGFYPVVLDSVQPSNPQHIRGRRASQQENQRIEEEYARLREHHVAEQRLRSQSVDPSAGRSAGGGGGVVVYPERASPFQPYVGPGGQQHHQKHVAGDHHGTNGPPQDPRLFHPAAMAQSSNNSSSHYNHQYYQDPNDSRSNIKQAVLSRAEKIQQLRTMYQQKHRQREGVYPLDDTEEQYEKQIQQQENKVGPSLTQQKTPRATGNVQADIGRRDAESPVFERNRQNERGHPSVRSYGSSSSMTNISSNNMPSSSTATTAFNHQLHYTHSNSSGSSSSNRQPRSRPQSRGASGGTFPREGSGGFSSYYQQDNVPIMDSHQHYYHHSQQQQQQQPPHYQSSSSYYPPQQSQQQQHHHQHHHTLPHSSRVNSSQEEITSFSGYDYDDFDISHHHHHNNNNNQNHHHHPSRNPPDGYRGDGSGGGGSTGPINIPQQQRFRTSPTPQFISSSLPYPSHHHYSHHNNSNHPDPAKV